MILLVVGLLIGATAGVFIACLLVAAKRGDDLDDEDMSAYVEGYLHGTEDQETRTLQAELKAYFQGYNSMRRDVDLGYYPQEGETR